MMLQTGMDATAPEARSGHPMTRTRTKLIDYEKLQAHGSSAVLIVKLMMACNDMQLANEAMSNWKQEQPRNRQNRQAGATMYFVRLQMSHLLEALKVMGEIKKDPDLSALISSCDSRTQASFRKVEACLKGGHKHSWFHKIVGSIRGDLTFHYNESGKLIERTITERADRPGAQLSSITRGSTAYLWHFQIADEIVDGIVVRRIWNIPRGKDVRIEADAILDELHDIFLAFVDFAGEFIWKFSSP
jgi:hypothetical protein